MGLLFYPLEEKEHILGVIIWGFHLSNFTHKVKFSNFNFL